MNLKNYFLWAAQIAAAFIFLQTLFFKFSGAQVSIEIFSMLGAESWGRYSTGILELIAGVTLLIPSVAAYGALIGIVIGAGAILSHLLVLGVSFGGDISLFVLAVVVTILCIIISYMRREQLQFSKS